MLHWRPGHFVRARAGVSRVSERHCRRAAGGGRRAGPRTPRN
eukprot:COSAG02_NODE_1662_length_11443_cov_3.729020_2_plen_42_part_00